MNYPVPCTLAPTSGNGPRPCVAVGEQTGDHVLFGLPSSHRTQQFFLWKMNPCYTTWPTFNKTSSLCTGVSILCSNSNNKNGCSTWCSKVVTHLSTSQARTCLTSQIGRDEVLAGWYGRIHPYTFLRWPPTVAPVEKRKKGDTFSINACHPCAGTMLIFSVSFQF